MAKPRAGFCANLTNCSTNSAADVGCHVCSGGGRILFGRYEPIDHDKNGQQIASEAWATQSCSIKPSFNEDQQA